MAKGHNKPPVELSREDAQFVADVLERDMFQGLQILTQVQAGTTSIEAAKKTVAYMEAARPVLRCIKEQLL